MQMGQQLGDILRTIIYQRTEAPVTQVGGERTATLFSTSIQKFETAVRDLTVEGDQTEITTFTFVESVDRFDRAVQDFADSLAGREALQGTRPAVYGGAGETRCTAELENLGQFLEGIRTLWSTGDTFLEASFAIKDASLYDLVSTRIFDTAVSAFGNAVYGFTVGVRNFQKAQGYAQIGSGLGGLSSAGQGYHLGGVVTKPTLALIGEGGEPEVVVPLSRAEEFGFGGGGGVNINQTIVLSGDSSDEQSLATGEDQRIARIQNIMREEWVRIAIEQMRPGGILDESQGGRR
jgi:hypothetical protein